MIYKRRCSLSWWICAHFWVTLFRALPTYVYLRYLLYVFSDPDTEIDDILPPIEDFLTAPELAQLTSEKSFQFLFKLGYEYIHESYNRKLWFKCVL